MKGRKILIGSLTAIALQTGLLAHMIWDRAQLLKNGQEVALASGFIDPRDLFRGHYVTLRLQIERQEVDATQLHGSFEYGAPIWVSLAPGEGGFSAVKDIYAERPTDLEYPILRGQSGFSYKSGDTPRIVTLHFPIDRYFAPKLEAIKLENLRQDQRLGVVLSLSEHGKAAIKGITIDGERIYEEPLF